MVDLDRLAELRRAAAQYDDPALRDALAMVDEAHEGASAVIEGAQLACRNLRRDAKGLNAALARAQARVRELEAMDRPDAIVQLTLNNKAVNRMLRDASHDIDHLRREVGMREATIDELNGKPRTPIPLILHCPDCRERHVDEGDFATRPHHTHACQHCGMVWRPAVHPTVGVRFLPGFKNEAT